jgi:hypothetical protein
MADPRNYREKAECCIEMANESMETRVQSVLFDIARAWTELARELEGRRDAQANSLGSAGVLGGARRALTKLELALR